MYNNLELIQMKLPKFYHKYEYKSEDEKSIMYPILSAIANRLDNSADIMARLDAAIGIDTAYDEDLAYRWGNLLGISKKDTESYDLYRSELKSAIPSLVGGTKDAIIYAIAIAIGIEKDSGLQDDYIQVIDGWEYDGDASISDEFRQYGSFICIIDLNVGEGALNVEQQVVDLINKVKASGTTFTVLYKSFKVLKYYNFDVFNYDTLDNISYSDLGVE